MKNLSIKAKQNIIIAFESILAGTYFIISLLSSTLNSGFAFRWIHNQNTGEPLGLIACLFLYLLLFFLAGMVFSGSIIVISEIPCFILNHSNIKENETTLNVLGPFGFLIGYAIMAILFILHISGIATIDFLFV